MIKGAGFCINSNCAAYYNSHFYMGTDGFYVCKLCKKLGCLEKNSSTLDGFGLCRTVRVHFKYDTLNRAYKSIAQITNEALDEKNTKTLNLYRPLIRVDASALVLAEKAMASLATGHSGLIVDLSNDDLFREAISRLENSLQTSEYLKADLGSDFVPLGR